jgi:hypothetical protein
MGTNTANPAGDPVVKGFETPIRSSGTEFKRFEDLASKLVQVSKKELDEKRKEG